MPSLWPALVTLIGFLKGPTKGQSSSKSPLGSLLVTQSAVIRTHIRGVIQGGKAGH